MKRNPLTISPQDRALFCGTIYVFSPFAIHINAPRIRESLDIVPEAAMWMEIEQIAEDGLLVGSSHGLLP
jgi:hypothetical protein